MTSQICISYEKKRKGARHVIPLLLTATDRYNGIAWHHYHYGLGNKSLGVFHIAVDLEFHVAVSLPDLGTTTPILACTSLRALS